MKQTIGILAGMGPKSTAPFLSLLIEKYQKEYGVVYDIDFPPIMIYSLPTPFFPDRPIDHQALEKAILEGLKRLEKTNVSYIVMPCVTAHIYFESLEKQLKVPLLNMLDHIVEVLPPSKKITAIGTRPTLESGIFQNKIASLGLEFVYEDDWQNLVDSLLYKLKAGQGGTEDLWKDILTNIASKDVETIIVVCTNLEIPSHLSKDLTVIDSMNCLATQTVQYYKQFLDQ